MIINPYRKWKATAPRRRVECLTDGHSVVWSEWWLYIVYIRAERTILHAHRPSFKTRMNDATYVMRSKKIRFAIGFLSSDTLYRTLRVIDIIVWNNLGGCDMRSINFISGISWFFRSRRHVRRSDTSTQCQRFRSEWELTTEEQLEKSLWETTYPKDYAATLWIYLDFYLASLNARKRTKRHL